MKKTLLFFLALLISFSCEKNDENLGGLTFEGIFIETEAGLVEAHNYKLDVPADGGEYDFNLAAVKALSKSHNIMEDFYEGIQTVPGDYPDNDGYYRGKLHLSISQNDTGKKRSADLYILSQSKWAIGAVMRINQDKGNN